MCAFCLLIYMPRLGYACICPHATLRQMQKRLESGDDGVATDHPRPRGPEYDLALKSLLEAAHDGFLALIAPGASFLQSLPTELPASARVADLVWEVIRPAGDVIEQAIPTSERVGLLHIELQTSPDREIGERVAGYSLQSMACVWRVANASRAERSRYRFARLWYYCALQRLLPYRPMSFRGAASSPTSAISI